MDLEGYLPFNYTNHPGDVTANNDWDPHRGYYKCETSTDSGYTSNVRKSAEKLRDMSPHTWCYVLNGSGSHCTGMVAAGNAAAGICGPQYEGVKCNIAGYAVHGIAEYCDWRGYAGGTVWFEEFPKIRIIVFRFVFRS